MIDMLIFNPFAVMLCPCAEGEPLKSSKHLQRILLNGQM